MINRNPNLNWRHWSYAKSGEKGTSCNNEMNLKAEQRFWINIRRSQQKEERQSLNTFTHLKNSKDILGLIALASVPGDELSNF